MQCSSPPNGRVGFGAVIIAVFVLFGVEANPGSVRGHAVCVVGRGIVGVEVADPAIDRAHFVESTLLT